MTKKEILHSVFPKENWKYRENDSKNLGRYFELELIDNNIYTNKKLYGKLKGTANSKRYELGNEVELSVALDISLIKYAYDCSVPFVLFFVDVKNNKIYYLELQDYLMKTTKIINKLKSNKTINVHIPKENIIEKNDPRFWKIIEHVYNN